MRFTLNLKEVARFLSKDLGLSFSDRSLILGRLSTQGVSFLTKTLPKFCKTVLQAIEHGQFPPRGTLTEFSRKGGLPRFLRDYLLMVFEKDGALKSNPDPLGLYVVRQLCEYLYKLAVPFSDECLAAAERQFIETDNSLGDFSYTQLQFIEELRRNVETHYRYPSVAAVLSDYRPRFGPGTYAGSSSRGADGQPYYLYKAGDGATKIPRDYAAISGYFKSYPSSGRLSRVDSDGQVAFSREKITFAPDTSDRSEVLFVPKDSRGPRVIMREPLQRLKLQMAYFDWLSSFLEKSTRGRVNFADQSVNQRLAQLGSKDGSWATLDLKEASDRVSSSLCFRVFRNIPVMRYFVATRGNKCVLPSGKTHQLKKLAGMGSGLTFATMSFLIHAAIATRLSGKYRGYVNASKVVYVYGDDIVLPREDVKMAVEALENIGLLVNIEKSYYRNSRAPFRESCGGDYFMGNDVGIVRLKLSAGLVLSKEEVFPEKGRVKHVFLQLERHCRELVKSGLGHLAEYYYQSMERAFGPLPQVSGESPVLGRYTLTTPRYPERDSGQYGKVPAWLPLPVVEGHSNPNVYHFVGKVLQPTEIDGLSYLVSKSPGRGCEVSKPRAVRLVKRRVSAFRLMG